MYKNSNVHDNFQSIINYYVVVPCPMLLPTFRLHPLTSSGLKICTSKVFNIISIEHTIMECDLLRRSVLLMQL